MTRPDLERLRALVERLDGYPGLTFYELGEQQRVSEALREALPALLDRCEEAERLIRFTALVGAGGHMPGCDRGDRPLGPCNCGDLLNDEARAFLGGADRPQEKP